MEITILILSVLLVLVIFLLFHSRKQLKVRVETNKLIQAENAHVEQQLKKNREEWAELQGKLEAGLSSLESMHEQAKNAADSFYDKSMEIASTELAHSLEKAGEEYQHATDEFMNDYLQVMQEAGESISQSISYKKKELEEVEKELFEIRNTRAALIEAQLREKRINEQLDFYCLHLDPVDEEDILVLDKIKARLHKPRILSMLIWQTYYLKQMNTLAASILGSKPITGIYKITNVETTECYIGQAVNVASRWKEHAKCGLGIDTPAGNKLYKAMQKYGLSKFSWELLEECSVLELNEKEAYYIELYKSVDFGYNTLKGVKN